MELSMMRRYWPAKSIFFPEKTRGRPAFISVKIVLVARPVKQSELFLRRLRVAQPLRNMTRADYKIPFKVSGTANL